MDTRKQVTAWVAEGKTNYWIADNLQVGETTIRRWKKKWGIVSPPKPLKPALPPTDQEAIRTDRKIQTLTETQKITKKKYEALLQDVDQLEGQIEAIKVLKGQPKDLKIQKLTPKGTSEATIIALFSDWHIEEKVTLEQTSGLSEYNLEISEKRARQCFARLLRFVEIERQNTKINTVVIALLGDFISSDIHDDTSKSALLEPAFAIVRCRNYIYSGIKFILDNSDLQLKIICHSGNHGRKDKNQLIANEAGSSLEYLMYHFLASDFKDEERIEFHIPDGYHSYLQVYEWTLRFHHGHAIRYAGGVGGITIPVNKAIASWNEGRRANIDCFGHFHQALDGETFIANGSLIGYSAYALWVKGRFQKPKQVVFGIHNKLGKFFTRHILFR